MAKTDLLCIFWTGTNCHAHVMPGHVGGLLLLSIVHVTSLSELAYSAAFDRDTLYKISFSFKYLHTIDLKINFIYFSKSRIELV